MQPVDHATFRTVLGHLPTGVVALSALPLATRPPVGLVVGTFQSLSLDPPMVTFSVDRSSTSWPKLRGAGRLCANILATGQVAVCKELSTRQPDKFASILWSPSEHGTPRIHGAHAWIDCTIRHELDGGDHVIVLADVLHLEAGDGEPLVFHRGELGGYRASSAA
ncbi:flavin reductase family protein [Pseudonocardia phyllosphaerae]|uniref:flavin reductase family protein n=1 Tax=Pseudonocardia phyllosphaerae TaxID=3390502 RepID=UPI00397E4F49